MNALIALMQQQNDFEWFNNDELTDSEQAALESYLYSLGYQSGDYFSAGDCYV